ncbi:hypothetical protein EV714DRAFT_197885 [Schizophyllum commune]
METVLRDAATRSNPELLRSGVVPNDDCSAGIKEDLRAMERVHNNIQCEIDDLVLLLAHAVGRRSDVERQQATSRAMLSPIRQIPPEIMSKIFEFATPEDWTQALVGTRTLNFAAVCKVWRTIALETPQLWNSFSIDFWQDPKRWQDAFDLRVARCGQIPLQLRFTFDFIGLHGWGADVWEWLSTQSHRWAALTIDDLPPQEQGPQWQWTWPRHLPILTNLELIANSSIPPPFSTFTNAPVTSLKICYMTNPRAVAALPSTWTITDLTIDCQHELQVVDLMPFLHIIAGCSTSLQSLDVAAWRIKEMPAFVAEGMVFPALETVKLSFLACELLTYVTTPRLASLYLRGFESHDHGKDARLLERCVEMLSQSSAGTRDRLRSLELVDFAGATGTIIQCLDLLPALSSLDIVKSRNGFHGVSYIVSRSLLCALARDPLEPTTMDRLPQLKRLGLKLGWPEGKDYDKAELLKEILLSRTKECEYEGKELTRLERFETDLPGDWELSVALEN